MNDELRKVKKEISEQMGVRIVRDRLIQYHPFTAGILLRLNLIPVYDKRLDTACTDGKSIYFDIDFWKSLSADEQMFVMAHEVWHCVMLHFLRRQGRDPELFNVATDMEINNLLCDDGFKVLSQAPLPPNEWKGQSAEWIYDKLLEESKKQQNKNGQGNNKGQGGNNASGNGGGSSQKNDPSYGNTKVNGKSFDKHIYEDVEQKGPSDDQGNDDQGKSGGKKGKSGNGELGEKGFDPDYNPTPASNGQNGIAEEIRSAIIEEAQKIERTAGSLPAYLTNILGKFLKPGMPWKSILAQFVTQCYSSSRRWFPVNRRYVWQNTYMQSRRDDRLNIVVAVDTSGSCSEDLNKFYSEITGLVKSFGKYRVTVIECDSQVAFAEEYNDDTNPFPKFDDIKWHGGGGTQFAPVFDYVADNQIAPDAMVFFTDGYDYGEKLKDPGYPVLWILTKDGNKDFCDFGRKTYFKK